MSGFITVLFTCHTCGLQHVRTVVPSRRKGQDVIDWVNSAMVLCAARHKQLNPNCGTGHLDLAIPQPLNEGDGLGESAAPVGDTSGFKLMPSKAAN